MAATRAMSSPPGMVPRPPKSVEPSQDSRDRAPRKKTIHQAGANWRERLRSPLRERTRAAIGAASRVSAVTMPVFGHFDQ
ncbi:hypothetical protein ACIPY6_28920 [Streptomyces sp. NPDC090054]|uniref:hypothetical protein n=1 Tax=Streptomyces sp. NPDC090054 TaxID=3365933 RepID=UPI0037FA415D